MKKMLTPLKKAHSKKNRTGPLSVHVWYQNLFVSSVPLLWQTVFSPFLIGTGLHLLLSSTVVCYCDCSALRNENFFFLSSLFCPYSFNSFKKGLIDFLISAVNFPDIPLTT